MTSVGAAYAAPFGVGDLWVADTSVPDVLQSQSLQIPAQLTNPGKIQYEIGFSSREQADLGFIFDSLTLTLARANGSDAFNLVTGDVFGLTIAPVTPGSLLSGGAITVEEIAPRSDSLISGAPVLFAYNVEVSLPAELVGQDLRTSFSFFNNGDAAPSQGYAVAVPEPGPAMLLGLAALAGILFRKRKARA